MMKNIKTCYLLLPGLVRYILGMVKSMNVRSMGLLVGFYTSSRFRDTHWYSFFSLAYRKLNLKMRACCIASRFQIQRAENILKGIWKDMLVCLPQKCLGLMSSLESKIHSCNTPQAFELLSHSSRWDYSNKWPISL